MIPQNTPNENYPQSSNAQFWAQSSTNKQNLIDMALSVIAQGHLVIPVSGKSPNIALMPRDPRKPLNEYGQHGKSSNLFIEQNQSPTNEDVISWACHPQTTGLGLLTGKITVLEFDDKEAYKKWLACDGVRDIVEFHRLPNALSGSGRGYHLPFVVTGVPDGVVISTKILAWVRNEEKVEGRSTAIEVKGYKSPVKMTYDYVLLPGSRHKSGGVYQELSTYGGSYSDFPPIPYEAYLTLLNAASSVCEAPKSKQTIEREARNRADQAKKASQPRREYSRYDGQSPIDRFNQENDVEEMLGRYNYTRVSFGNWAYGGKGKATVHVWANGQKSSHHHPNDPLHEGNSGKRAHSAFDIYCHFEHDGHIREAVKELAEEYRIDYATMYEDERRQASRKSRVPAAPAAPVSAAPVVLAPAASLKRVDPGFLDCPPPPPPPPLTWLDEHQGSSDNQYQPSDAELAEYYAVPLQATPRVVEIAVPAAPNQPKAAPMVDWRSIKTDYDRFDWRIFKAQVDADFDLARYKEENGLTGDHGVFESVAMVLFGEPDTSKGWAKILKAAATYANVEYPSFKKLGWTRDDTIEYAKRVAGSFKVIEVPRGKYISDVFDYDGLGFGQTHQIIAGCGLGKTYAGDKITPKSFFTPMARQADTFTQAANARGANAHAVREGIEHKGQDVVYSTYDGAKKETAQLVDDENPLSLNGRTAFLDEIQHLATDGYRRKTALVPLMTLSKLYLEQGGRIISLSGTPTPLLPHPIGFEGSNVLVFTRNDDEQKRYLYLFRESDPVEAIKKLIDEGFTHITYVIDNRNRCEDVAITLNKMGICALPIHSQNKNELPNVTLEKMGIGSLKHDESVPFHQAYTGDGGQDGAWHPQVKVYVTTRATLDGFSVIVQPENVRLAEVFDVSLQFSSGMIEQRSRRVRNHDATVYVGFKDDILKKLGAGGHFDLEQAKRDHFEEAEMHLNSAKKLQLFKLKTIERDQLIGRVDLVDDANKQALEYAMAQYKGWVTISDEDELIIDELGVNNRIEATWCAAANNQPDVMINELESYGFEFRGMVNLTGNKEDAKARDEAFNEVRKAIKESALADIKKASNAMTDQMIDLMAKDMKAVIKDDEDPRPKLAAAKLRRDFWEMGLSSEGAKETIQALTSVKKKVITRIRGKVKLAKIRRAMPNADYMRRADNVTRFYGMLQDGQTFQLGEILTSQEIRERVEIAANACGVPEILTPYTAKEKRLAKKKKENLTARHDSNSKIMRLIKDIYQVKRAKKEVGEKRENAHELVSFIELDLAEFVPVAPMEIEPEACEPKAAPERPEDVEQANYEVLKRLYESGWIDYKTFLARLSENRRDDEFNQMW